MKDIEMRCLTIQEGVRNLKYKPERTRYPIIKLEGVWLEDAGFLPNTPVYLFVEDGKITIKNKPERKAEAAAMQVFEALTKAG